MNEAQPSAYGLAVTKEVSPGVTQPPAASFTLVKPRLPNWTPPELEIVNRYARALAEGRHRSSREAAPDCARDLEAFRQRNPSLPPRPTRAVRVRLRIQCRALGLTYAVSFWGPAELSMAKRCAREFLAGRFPTIRDAARQCRRRLADELSRQRTLGGVCWHIARVIRTMGVPAREQEWTEEEEKELARHVRMLHCGRQLTVTDMSEECSRALGGRRSAEAIRIRLRPILDRIHLSRYHSFSEPFESELIERYARRAAAGELPSWHAGAEECHKTLEAEHARLARTAPGGASPDYGRTPQRTFTEMLRVAAQLGLRTPRDQRRWSDEENRMYESWRKWYHRHRYNRRNSPLTQAALGLQDDLADKGLRRSLDACRTRLGGYVAKWRLAHGLPPAKPRTRRTASQAGG